jgi:hypothetical protein
MSLRMFFFRSKPGKEIGAVGLSQSILAPDDPNFTDPMNRERIFLTYPHNSHCGKLAAYSGPPICYIFNVLSKM